MNFNEIKLKIESQWAEFDFFDWSSNFLLKRNRIVLIVFSLALLGYCAYLWYSFIYNPGWSESRKQEYIESRKEESVVFDKNNFNKVISETENRKNNFQKTMENIPDIFSLE